MTSDLGSIPRYRAGEIETLAQKTIVEHYATDAPEPPIDVEAILEAQPGVHFDIMPGLQVRYEGMLGLVYRRNSDLLVLVDADLADKTAGGRYRFTVGEELGHVVLHREVAMRIASPDDALALMRHPEYGDMDRDARRFAAAVLMPPQSLQQATATALPQLIELYGGFSNAEDRVVFALTKVLALRFQTSRQSMAIRITTWPARIEDRVRMAVAAGDLDLLDEA